MRIKHLLLFLSVFLTCKGFSQATSGFKFSEFSFANQGGPGNPSDPLAAGTYNGSPDWVEIYNSTTGINPLTLSGWWLSDDRYNARKWQIPTAIIGSNPIKLDSHAVCVVYLCGHDKSIYPASGCNTANVNVDLHANFTCNQTKPGAKVYLSNNAGTIKDSIDIYRYRNKPGHSWGHAWYKRKPSSVINSLWRLYDKPTPGVINPDTTATFPNAWYYGYCPTPKVDPGPGFFNGGPTTVNLNVTDTAYDNTINSQWYQYNTSALYNGGNNYSSIQIYGTSDCSIPVYTNTQAQSIASGGSAGTQLNGTFAAAPTNIPASIVRIMVHDANTPRQGYLDSWEFYGAYLDDSLNSHKLPITCVCMNGPDTAKAFTYTTPLPQDSLPMIIHHFDDMHKHAFKNQGQAFVTKIDFFNPVSTAAASRRMWQFVFRSEDEYGYNYTNTSQFYKDQTLGYSSRTNFPEIMFRSAAEENFLFPGVASGTSGFLPAHIRDFYNHTISLRHDLKFDASHYTPTYMIFNGWPRGIYYIKETIDSLYTDYYYGHKNAAILVNSLAGTQSIGAGLTAPNASTRWNWFYNWAMNSSTNVHQPVLYYRIADSLDFGSFNDYMIYNLLSVNTNFIKKYALWWKGVPDDTSDHRINKWRFGLTNTDCTWGYDLVNMASIGNTSPTSDPCDYMASYSLFWPSTGTAGANGAYPLVPLWYKLMSNDTFKSEFVTRYSDLLNGALSCDSLQDHLKYLRTKYITPAEMAGHVWYNVGDASGTCTGCDSTSYWNDQLDSMNVFLAQRCSLVNEGLKNCFTELSGPYNVCIDVSPANSGYVQFNSLELHSFVWNGKYFDSVINVIKAFADTNYVFDHWETSYTLSPGADSDSATFYTPMDGCIKAIFKLRPAYETTGTPMLPTGFSPNNDGNNDILNIYGILNASSYELEVFNRWGERVFYSTDKTQGWDGKFNGTDAPAGVYAYRYAIKMNGKDYASKGNVTLVR